MVNLFGASGYIGSCYVSRHEAVCQSRDDLVPVCPKILYMISTTHNHHLKTNPWIDVDTNIVTLLRVLENCRHAGVTEFNFVSSWFVYGATDEAVAEDAACRPQGFYSITKHTAEQLLVEYCQTHGISWRIFRVCNVLGGVDSGAGLHKNAVWAVIQRMSRNETLTLSAGGMFYRDYLHVNDVCDAMHYIMQHGNTNSVYNLGTGQSVRFRDVVTHIGSILNLEPEIIHDANTVIDCLLDCSRLSQLGWRPQLSWHDAVLEMVQRC
jgi:nucleoside-diphosphate-sugar epimerase